MLPPSRKRVAMITSARCRLYASKSQLLGKTLDVSSKRRDQALIMALRWSRLADQIDRDAATTAPELEISVPRNPPPATCSKCDKPMRFMLVKNGGRKFRCIDCDGPDPLRLPEVTKLLEGELRSPE
jgi:hypothetical protein